jgi:hypothetical protein
MFCVIPRVQFVVPSKLVIAIVFNDRYLKSSIFFSDFILFNNAAVIELVNRLKDSGNYMYRTF